jgi:hypothetical protein
VRVTYQETVVALVVESLSKVEIASSNETTVLLLRNWHSGADGWVPVESENRFVAQTAVLLAMTGTDVSFIQSGGSRG